MSFKAKLPNFLCEHMCVHVCMCTCMQKYVFEYDRVMLYKKFVIFSPLPLRFQICDTIPSWAKANYKSIFPIFKKERILHWLKTMVNPVCLCLLHWHKQSFLSTLSKQITSITASKKLNELNSTTYFGSRVGVLLPRHGHLS